MKLLRSVFALIACTAIALSVHADESPKDLLLGKWRHTTLVRVIDGNALLPQQLDGTTSLEFKADNTWVLIGPNNRSAGSYRWLDSGALETTTLESGLAIQMGLVSVKQVRVDHERLNLITVQTQAEASKFMPPPTPGVYRPKEVVVTSIFGKDKGH